MTMHSVLVPAVLALLCLLAAAGAAPFGAAPLHASYLASRIDIF